jgi:probable rRNA maturation factor
MQARSTSKDGQDFAISLANEQSRHTVDEQALIEAARAVLANSDFDSANVSLAVVDDVTIHELNRRHLNHDWPTDVLSFVLDDDGNHLEGEVIISADTAAATAAEVGSPAVAEQVLYVVHGMLHLVGYEDATAADRSAMRAAEAALLRSLGWEPPRGLDDGTCDSTSVAAGNDHPGATVP